MRRPRRREVAAAVAVCGGLSYVACVFSWEIREGHDTMREKAPLFGTVFELRWAFACAALVLAAAACAWAEGVDVVRRAAPVRVPRALRVGGGASRVGYVRRSQNLSLKPPLSLRLALSGLIL